jgi:recombination protein RecA
MSIEDLKKKLQGCVDGVHIEVLSESTIASERKWFPTPSYDLNRILSGSLYKGLPSKSLTLLVAPEASFKSSFMCLCAAKAQKEGYTPIIFDTEGAWSSDFVKRWGLNADNILYIYTPWIDKISVLLGQLIDDEDISKQFLILDSLGGLEKIKMIVDAVGKDKRVKADQGTLQKEIKRMLKMFLNIVKGKDSVGMIAGHFFGNPNSYGGADEIGGGKFAKLAPDIIISQKKINILKDPKAKVSDRVVIGTLIKAMTLKNRYYPPFQEATIDINYKDGINEFAGLLDMAIKSGIIKRNGGWYTMPNDDKIQGAANTITWFKENSNIILDSLEKYLSTSGYSTVNEEMLEIDKLVKEDKEDKEV